MIYIGYNYNDKKSIINKYINKNFIRKIFVFQPEDRIMDYSIQAEYITYKNLIEYEYFYKVLQEADQNTLIIIDECMRTQNRNDLTYNCLRHFINQSGHELVFQYLPIIEDINDFMILFDFDTKSRWKREKYNKELLNESIIRVKRIDIEFIQNKIDCSAGTIKKYEKEKDKLFQNIGLKDPHTIPRNLYLVTGKEKLKVVKEYNIYIGRNNRFNLPNMNTYKGKLDQGRYVVFEFPHNYIDFTDFLFFSQQEQIEVLTTDSKIDQWYFNRYINWIKNLEYAYNSIIQ